MSGRPAVRRPEPAIEAGLGALLILALLAPWVGVSLFGFSDSASGLQLVSASTNPLTVLFLVAAVVALGGGALRAVVPDADPRVGWVTLAGFIGGVAMTAWLLVVWFQSQNGLLGLSMQFVQLAWGVWLYGLAAVIGAGVAGYDLSVARRGHAAVAERRERFERPDERRSREWPVGRASARLGVVESGRALPTVTVRAGEALIVGRDPGADVRLTDARVSRRHLQIEHDTLGWLVRDLGATNPTRLLEPSGAVRDIRGEAVHLASGQLLLGDALVTLYPEDAR